MSEQSEPEDKGAEAWRVAPGGYQHEHPPVHDAARLSSCYVTTRDGTRLAVDVHLPGRDAEERRYPAILLFTPYYRRFALKPGHRGKAEACPNIALFRDGLLPYGYAIVAVDIRGCGGSFGTRDGFRSPRERGDHFDVADWVAAQPWCDGNLGSTGISYVGAAADFLASTGHPAVKAVVPTFSVWDTWSNHLYPGGVLLNCITKHYGALAEALDWDQREALKRYAYFRDPDYAGPAPVDEDPERDLLCQALAEHRGNFDMQDFAQQFRFRDDGLSDNPDYTSASISPYHYTEARRDQGPGQDCATYSISGWMDGGGFSNGAIQRHNFLRNPKNRLLLGPWDHGARSNVSPWRKDPLPGFALIAEVRRFFDHHLKGLDTGLEREAPVHYFTMGEERWKTALSWPPPEIEARDFHFAADGNLSGEPQGVSVGADDYQADFDCRSGLDSRYDRLYAAAVTRYYGDWQGRDARMRCYTTARLEAALEVTGHPAVTLHFVCSERDCAFFVYLEDITAEGKCLYVTEGVFRALHRKPGANPPSLPATGPTHSFKREDALLLQPGEAAELSFDLLPTSYLFQAGHRIRVAIAAADSDHFTRIPDGRPPRLTFYRDSERPSRITLPIMPPKAEI